MTWPDVRDLMSRGKPGSWGSLVGGTWPAVARVLHPAYRLDDHNATAVKWAQLGSPGADTSWFALTGHRLHSGGTGPGWDAEPAVGPLDPAVTVPLLRRLGVSQETCLYVGEWSGYGNSWPSGEAIEGVNREWSLQTLHGSDEINAWLQQLPTGAVPLPSLVWPHSLQWVMNADVDLPSTVVGSSLRVLEELGAAEELECVRATVEDPVVS